MKLEKKAIIISLAGLKLSKHEIVLLKRYSPWGIILFKRNIKNYNQLKELIYSIKKITKDKNYPILIDEEGGEVSRLQNIINNSLFSQRYFGKLFDILNGDPFLNNLTSWQTLHSKLVLFSDKA